MKSQELSAEEQALWNEVEERIDRNLKKELFERLKEYGLKIE
ncbi:hypothetical protein [Prochlorococcus sp. MIT 0801]|nr:hypothetical protein [Prochlorococcus sp. MIT 0801]AIQ97582.1 hypothetical protein EW15_1490 [Prochlorococcus sp. MIT 0801]